MAEDKGDKTEAPTPRRRQQAREQGNVARSPDVVAALILLGVMVLLHSTGPRMVAILKALVHDMLSQDSLANLTFASAGGGLLHACYSAGAAMAPLLLGVVLIAIVGNVVQVGFIFNPGRLSPNLNALNPAGGRGPRPLRWRGPPPCGGGALLFLRDARRRRPGCRLRRAPARPAPR